MAIAICSPVDVDDVNPAIQHASQLRADRIWREQSPRRLARTSDASADDAWIVAWGGKAAYA